MSQSSSRERVATGTKRLAEAVRAAKIAGAQRSDVVVDIREADRARLEIFAEELQPIVEAVPGDDDLFDFMLSGGPQPRFWIDGTAHVTMARDRRTYRLLRETRLGRVTLAEASEPHVMVDHVTDYVAERMVERDQAYALSDGMGGRLAARTHARKGADGAVPPMGGAPDRRGRQVPLALSWLTIGILLGIGGLAVLASLRGMPLF